MSTLRSKFVAQALWSLVLDDKHGGDDVAERFVRFLDENNLFHMAPAVVRHLERLSGAYAAEHTLHIRVAHPVSARSIDAVRSRLHAPARAHVAIEEDSDILGGFVASYGEMLYDASLRNQLAILKERLLS
jgi:F0F1-type ATP synthase delta subunit